MACFILQIQSFLLSVCQSLLQSVLHVSCAVAEGPPPLSEEMDAGVIVVDVPCPTVEKPVARKLRHFRFTVKWLIRKLLVR